ncbi:RNA polymerase sigma factor [Nocardia africana]
MAGRSRAGSRSPEEPRRRDLRLVPQDRYPSWEEVYRDNVGWVYALIFGKVGNTPDAEDLTAEVFVAALKPLRITASVAEVRAYLRTTARTVLAGYWRTRMGREITVIDDDFPDETGSAPTDSTDSRAPEHVRAVLSGLPERYRRILELRFLQGLSVRDAAAALAISVPNAKVLQHRALRAASELNIDLGL